MTEKAGKWRKKRHTSYSEKYYQESSLIVSGLSPDFGRLDFLLKGARGTGAKKFPYAELFRELVIEFRPPRLHSSGTLCTLTAHEPAEAFDAIAARTENYLAMCAFAAFLLKHTKPMLEAPETFHALETLLFRLTTAENPEFPLAAAKLMFLRESGFLPESPGADNLRQERILESLLKYAADRRMPEPALRAEYREKLMQWIRQLCEYHDLR